MNISILGTGRMGTALAAALAKVGYQPILGSREAERAASVAASIASDTGSIRGLSLDQAAAAADVIFFAFPWYALVDIERAVGQLEKKIIVDCINPIGSSGSLMLGHKRSAAEEIQASFPLAQVVKGFNHIYYSHLADPIFSGRPATAFYCSDHDAAKAVFHQLATDLGFEPVDTGPIKHARYLEPMATLWLQMAFHLGMGPEMAISLLHR